MSTWTLLYAETVSGELLGELPFVSMDFSDDLNGSGSWSAVVPVDTYQGFDPGSICVYADRDGVILGSGIVWDASLDYAAGTMSIGGEGLGSYYRHRRITVDLNYAAWEQVDIVDSILTVIELLGHGVNATIGSPATGVLRDRIYAAREVKPVLEAIEEVALVEGGFDLRWRARWNAGTVERLLFCDYPTSGQLLDLVFEVGVNCALLTYGEDAANMANMVVGLGAGEGIDKTWHSISTYSMASSVPRFDDSVAHVDVNDVTVLDEYINRRLQRGSFPARRVTLTLAPDTLPNLGSFDVGDRVYVRAPLTWRTVAGYFRITGIGISVQDAVEEVTVELVGAEVFDEF